MSFWQRFGAGSRARQQNPLAQQSYTWEQLREKFLASNPTLQAARIGIEESHAQETTAYLRPNPSMTVGVDQIDPFPADPYRPFTNLFPYANLDYLHERAHKRELRLESAKKGTVVAESQLEDQQRNLLFNLRSGFVQALQAKAVLALAQENLSYYDKTLQVSRDRKQAGDIAQVDLDRLELQRVQYESDLQTATVNLRTAKIQLLQLAERPLSGGAASMSPGRMNLPSGLFPSRNCGRPPIEARPDLRAAVQSVDKAKTDYHLAAG